MSRREPADSGSRKIWTAFLNICCSQVVARSPGFFTKKILMLCRFLFYRDGMKTANDGECQNVAYQ